MLEFQDTLRLTSITAQQQNRSAKSRTNSISVNNSVQDHKPPIPTSSSSANTRSVHSHFSSLPYNDHISNMSQVDIDGMNVIPRSFSQNHSSPPLALDMNHESVTDLVSTTSEPGSLLDAPDSPATAAFAPLLSEIFGPSWRCPSPVVLHIGSPGSSSTSSDICPIWKKSNDIFSKVFQQRPGAANLLNSSQLEAGLLFLGIKQGWASFNEWMQSPALRILKEVDQFLFCHLPRMERLAVAYKSFKLLKVRRLVLAWGRVDGDLQLGSTISMPPRRSSKKCLFGYDQGTRLPKRAISLLTPTHQPPSIAHQTPHCNRLLRLAHPTRPSD